MGMYIKETSHYICNGSVLFWHVTSFCAFIKRHFHHNSIVYILPYLKITKISEKGDKNSIKRYILNIVVSYHDIIICLRANNIKRNNIYVHGVSENIINEMQNSSSVYVLANTKYTNLIINAIYEISINSTRGFRGSGKLTRFNFFNQQKQMY